MGKARGHRRLTSKRLLGAVAVACAAALVPSLASAHVERASYWPDPAPDTSVSPPAGGSVPAARSLFTALDPAPPGDTRVVCQGKVPKYPAKRIAKARRLFRDGVERRKIRRLKRGYRRKVNRNTSIARLRGFVKDARAHGFKYRPLGELQSFTKADAEALTAFNKRLLKRCHFNSIQDAVNASHNNDRVVVMPGIYTEPKSRAAPTFDPKCDGLEEMNDRSDGMGSFQTGALSYAYQFTCPNDQNLIAIMGREPRHDQVEQPPLMDRHGIPDEGPCIRCNLQLEGSGVSADDVVVDAGRVASGNGGPAEPVKDVTIRADRADGFVLANLTARHAAEHDIYVPETDGARLERFKTFYDGEYGVLTFVADHHLIQNCEAMGSGDAAIYPGSSADVGEQKAISEPTERFSTEIRFCDMHHSSAGYSGTAANAVHIHDNNFYGNALGLTTDVFTAAGHPGFPQDSDLIEDNNFFSNNFNPYVEESDIEPTIPVPVGTGLWIAGGNNDEVRNNRFWDNWRRGAMLFAVPDAFVCGDGPTANGNQQAGCDQSEVNTSYRNEFHDNVMGVAPDGTADPNGTDWWWDEFASNTENCWYDNTGPDGTRDSITADPPLNPVADTSIPGFLPEDCATSVGTGGDNDAELLSCLANFGEDAPTPCDWFTTPPEP